MSPSLLARFARDLEALTGAPVPRFGVAVSGGPDSLALLRLAAHAFPGHVEAATVDHGLSPTSPAEAAHVACACADLGVPHETLPVRVVPAGEGLQSAARTARYAVLEDWATTHALPALLTAHHADDQAETLLMRLNRGSGVAGLAGIRPSRPLRDTTLYRPLLGWRRAELADIAAPLAPIDDPANADPRHDRTRIRRHLAETPWLDPAALARSAAALAQAEDALAEITDRLFASRATRAGEALLLDPHDVPLELLRRLVVRSLTTLVPTAALRGHQIELLLTALSNGGTMTLAGVRCSARHTYRFEPAPLRRGG